MPAALHDRRLKVRVAIRRGVHVEDWRQTPPSGSHVQEAVILEVIILVGHQDGEDQSQIEFAEIGGGICRVNTHEVDEAEARRMIRETAQRISGEWREALRKVGLAGAQAREYKAAFVNDQTELALTL